MGRCVIVCTRETDIVWCAQARDKPVRYRDRQLVCYVHERNSCLSCAQYRQTRAWCAQDRHTGDLGVHKADRWLLCTRETGTCTRETDRCLLSVQEKMHRCVISTRQTDRCLVCTLQVLVEMWLFRELRANDWQRTIFLPLTPACHGEMRMSVGTGPEEGALFCHIYLFWPTFVVCAFFYYSFCFVVDTEAVAVSFIVFVLLLILIQSLFLL